MDCTCCGFAVEGQYSYEGYWLPATSCLCGCHYDGTGPTWEPSSTPLAASVSASFSKSAVIFEDAYENQPGQWVGKNSTRTRLNIVANGGPNGGTLSVTSANIGKLSRISGPDLPLASVAVPAETQVSYAIVYEGDEASVVTNDIYVTALFSENDGGTNLHDSATLTCIRVTLDVDKIAPDNNCTNRHMYGVCELVHLRHCPESLEVEWTTMDASLIIDNDTTLRCHYLPGNSLLRAEFGAASLDIDFEIVAPKRIVCRGARWDGVVGQAGVAGDVTMELPLYVEPTNVSFEGLPIQEIIDDSQSGYHDGYFDDRTKGGSWSHDYASGAGDWHIVSTNGYWFTDRAGVRGSPSYVQPWINGRKEWAIPVGWSTPLGMEAVGSISPNPTTQTFIIDTNGTVRVLKYGHEIKRSTDGKVWLDGLRVN